MTRKDYQLIAEVIKSSRNYDASPQAEIMANLISRLLSIALSNDNPRFDKVKFLHACGALDDRNREILSQLN